jgi:hypothetical protein
MLSLHFLICDVDMIIMVKDHINSIPLLFLMQYYYEFIANLSVVKVDFVVIKIVSLYLRGLSEGFCTDNGLIFSLSFLTWYIICCNMFDVFFFVLSRGF